MKRTLPWMPGAIMAVGALFSLGIGGQRTLPLRVPLQTVISDSLFGFGSQDITLSDDETRVSGVTDYLLRDFRSDSSLGASLYIGYYPQQQRGRTIHSPKNCLPGTGWEPLASTVMTIQLPGEASVFVNRYIIQNDQNKALVLYWYQGRGRIAHNEYMVKWDLLRDAALRRRSDEALVRIVVPITGSEQEAEGLAHDVAAAIVPQLYQSLPE